jgi:glyceraldehyde-3-phosphate dehydrogenase/erythrose-4-phosphate dehydrogenase
MLAFPHPQEGTPNREIGRANPPAQKGEMMRTVSIWAAVLAAALLTACAVPVPIQNVDKATISSAADKALSADQVREAIFRAGNGLGWIVKEAGPGKLVGTLVLRTHMAVVDIAYSPTHYSITYSSSVNLKEGGGKIHPNYNGWIQNLTRAIDAQLAAA